MFKLLLLIAAVFGGLWWFSRSGSARPPRPRKGARMVRCEYCDVHVPEDEAVAVEGHTFCCDEHRRSAGY